MMIPYPVIPYTFECYRPSVATGRKAGFFLSDSSTQTEQSDIIDLQYAIEMLRTLTQVVICLWDVF